MSQMKKDDALKQWNFVKMQSQGTITDPVPHSVFNHILEKIDKDVLDKYNIKPEPLADTTYSGQFSTEEEFEDKIIEPMLVRWGLKFQRQYPCDFVIGSQSHYCQIDFLVRDGNGPITLFENKLRISSEKELFKAMLQAKSYSLQMGIENFVVASPEGFWIYSLSKNKEKLSNRITFKDFELDENRFKKLIIKFKN